MTMDAQVIRSLYHAKPFKPFYICLSDGRKIKVPLAERLAILKSPQSIVVAHKGSFEVVDLQQVVRLDVLNSEQAG
jgi:hypothetical protein